MSATILLDCPKCGRKIAIRGDSGTIHVTCPDCREQWDWPRRKASASGAAGPGAGTFFAGLSRRVGGWCRDALYPRRFSGAHLAVALLAGIGIGILLGTALETGEASNPRLELPSVPIPPAADGRDSASINILNSPDIDPKIDESVLTNLDSVAPAISNR